MLRILGVTHLLRHRGRPGVKPVSGAKAHKQEKNVQLENQILAPRIPSMPATT